MLLIEQTSPTRADNVVMQSVANAHVRTELCCKSRNTGLDITQGTGNYKLIVFQI